MDAVHKDGNYTLKYDFEDGQYAPTRKEI
jgi:hypothetical protein